LIEHLTQNQIEDFSRQLLHPSQLLSVSDHIDNCEACREQIAMAVHGDAAFFALRSEVFGDVAKLSSPRGTRVHPTAQQTASYVDGNLAGEDLQFFSDHLTNCEQCALAVDDLRAFKSQIAPSLDREYRPASVPSPAEGWWQRTATSLASIFRSPRMAFGAVVIVLLAALVGWMMWRTEPKPEPKEEVVVAPAPQPAPAVRLVAQLNDGDGQLTLDANGKLSGADKLTPALQAILKDALTGKRLESSSQLRGLTRRSSALMSSDKLGKSFSVTEPIGRVLISDRPTFRWSALEGATGYVVEVYDTKFNLVATSPQLSANSWAAQSLPRGSIYTWQVKAIKDGQEVTAPRPPAPQARFRILDQAKADELANARREYASSHLALGLLYAEAGLLKEAEEELRALQKANPDSEIARSLLNQVQALQR
jgi:anti-sigma factor RsiW